MKRPSATPKRSTHSLLLLGEKPEMRGRSLGEGGGEGSTCGIEYGRDSGGVTMCEDSCPEIRIGDLGEVFTGRTPSTGHPAYFGKDFPFITPGDMRQGKYARATERSVSHEGAELLKRIKLPANSVCVSCIGWQMGETIMTDRPSFTNQQINTIVPNCKVEPSFLYYSLRPRKQELLALGAMTGVRTPILNKSTFSDLKVKIPPLPTQRRIAGILSAYDELIDNNQRRIKILEEMARALYREWFIHFRYPGSGRETESEPSTRPTGHPSPSGRRGVDKSRAKLITTPLGEIPKGWEVKKLGELTAYLNRGLSPNYDDNGDSVVINQKCIRDQRLNLEPSRRQNKPVSPDKRVRFGDVLINSTGVGTLGRVAQVYQDLCECTVDTHVTIARPNPETDLDFFGCTLLSLQETFDRLGIGATGQTELSRSSIANVDLVVSPTYIQHRFGECVRPIRTVAMTHANQIQNLRRTRDLLLPRLLSGQVTLTGKET